MRRRAPNKPPCFPLFDAVDSDLRDRKWTTNNFGYARCTLNGQHAFGHRLVIERVIGRLLKPGEFVDHINFNRCDNRRCNLRVVTIQQNNDHRQARNATGLRGITFHAKAGKWMGQVRRSGRVHYCGLHSTPEAAAEAARQKRVELGFFGETFAPIAVAAPGQKRGIA
jgi:hypothetical protein